MSVPATIDALQTLTRSVAGIGSAPALADYPRDLGRETLTTAGYGYPVALTFPVEGAWRGATFAGERQDRYYRVLVLLQPASYTMDGAALVAFGALLQALGEVYTDARALDTGDSRRVEIGRGEGDVADSGLAIINYAGLDAYGVEFRLRVWEV